MAKPMMDFIIPTGTTTTCQQLDWTHYNGELEVMGGTFIANDLEENGLFGKYYIPSSGGSIELHNDGYVDLNGRIVMASGTMNVYGSGNSWWSNGGDATITMSGGVLDFHDSGIRIDDSGYSYTESITGGTIRTAGYFIIERTTHNPTGGEIELYGDVDVDIGTAIGSNFYDLRINKTATDLIGTSDVYKTIASNTRKQERLIVNNTRSQKTSNTQSAIIKKDRNGKIIELTRSNTVNAASELVLNGNLYIDNGTLDLNGFNVNVLNDVNNYGSLIVAVDDTLDTGNDMYLFSGSTVDLSGTILLGTRAGWIGDARHYSGSTFNQTDGDFCSENIYLYNGSQFNGTGGKTHIYANGSTPATNNIEINDPDSYFYDFYVDDGANAELDNCSYDLDVSHSTKIDAPLDINTFTLNSIYIDVHENGNLIIDDGGAVNVTGNGPYIHDMGTLTMVAGSELNSGSNIWFQFGSSENVTGGEIFLEGNFTNSSGIFTPTGGIVTFDGTSASSIIGATTFHGLTINKTGATVSTDATISMHDIVINSGAFDPSGFDIEVTGDWTNNVGDAGFVEGTQTVIFNGSYSSQITTDETFYNLTAANPIYTGWKVPTVLSDLTINVLNDLNIDDGCMKVYSNTVFNIGNDLSIAFDAGLDMTSFYNQQLNIGGNWINNNNSYTIWTGFHPGNNSIVTFNGSTDQYLTTAAQEEDFENLIINKSGGEFRSNDNIHVMGNLDIITGCWHDNASYLTHYFEGNFFVTAGTAACWNSLTGNIVVFTGTEDQTVYNPNGYHYFGNVVVDKTAWPTKNHAVNDGTEFEQVGVDNDNVNKETRTLTVTLTSNIDIQNGIGLTIDEGTLDLNGHNLYTMGDVIVNDGGKILVDEGAQLQVYGSDELAVNSGGSIEVLGVSGNLATVSHRSTGYYDFNVESGGTISAEYGLFEYMSTNGVFVRPGGIVDPTHSFDYCTFQNGTIGYATLLLIDNSDDITITGANFPDEFSSDYNVAKTIEPPAGQGYITMMEAIGCFAGEEHDYDAYDRINWITVLPPIDDLTINYSDIAAKGTIELNWTYSTAVDSFYIYRDTDPYFIPSTPHASVEGTTYTWSEPASGSKYFYIVTAYKDEVPPVTSNTNRSRNELGKRTR